MNVNKIITGYLRENCYILSDKDKNCIVIDPGADYDKIKNFIVENDLSVKAILITHYHFDHIGALEEIKADYPDALVIDYNHAKEQNICGHKFELHKNFGHSMDSVSYYFKDENIIFSGDFVFKGTIGIYEPKYESIMFKSLKEFKDWAPKDAKIYPGHNEETNVTNELENNYFLKDL